MTSVEETKIEQNKEEEKIRESLKSRFQKLKSSSSSTLSSSPLSSLAHRLSKLINEDIIALSLSILQDRLQALEGYTTMNIWRNQKKTVTNKQEVNALVSQAYEEVCFNGSDHFHILSDSKSHSQSDLNSCSVLSDSDQSSSCSE